MAEDARECKHCRKPIVRCNSVSSHAGCGSGYGWIHSNPEQRGHSCQPRSSAPYAQPVPVADDITALCTLQFSWGGLFDWGPAEDGYAVHLVRQSTYGGTPGPALCGIDRFAKDGPGWSVGGGISGPDIIHKPCPGCVAAAREQFPGLPVAGSVGAAEMAAELGVEVLHRG